MKLPGSIWLGLLLAFPALDASQLDWDSDFRRQVGDYRLTATGRYEVRLPGSWELLHTVDVEQHTDSDRLDKTARYRWDLGRAAGPVTPLLLFRYDRTLEEDRADDYSYLLRERAAGLGLDLTPLPGVNLTTRWYYARLDDRETAHPDSIRNGLLEQTDLGIEREIDGHRVRFQVADQRAAYHPDRPDYDRAELFYSANLPGQTLESRLQVRRDSEQLRDTGDQYRKSLSSSTEYGVRLGTVRFRLLPDLSYDENRIDGRPEKNYAHRDGQLRGEVAMPYGRSMFTLGLERELSSRRAEVPSNSEEVDLTGLDLALTRGWGPGDSLTVRYRIDLRQTDIPDGVGTLDNDRRNRDLEIGLYSRWKRRIALSAVFSKQISEQVYLRSAMSGQNTNLTSYSLQPAVEIDLGGGFYIGQDYHLRADYEDYMFPKMGDNRLFRRLQGHWRWGWDQSEGLRRISVYGRDVSEREGDENPFTTWLEYQYTTNGSGEWSGDAYEIRDERFQHQAGCSIRQEHKRLVWRLGGQIAWVSARRYGSQYLSRREGRPELELRYLPTPASEAYLLLQPVFFDTIRPDWRLTFRLTFRL